MVAGNRDVVSGCVHDVDDGFARGHRTDRLALEMVAVVHQQHIIVLRVLFLHGVQGGISPVLVDAAVNIARIEHDQVLLHRGSGGFLRHGAAQQQRQCQQESRQFLHLFSSRKAGQRTNLPGFIGPEMLYLILQRRSVPGRRDCHSLLRPRRPGSRRCSRSAPDCPASRYPAVPCSHRTWYSRRRYSAVGS